MKAMLCTLATVSLTLAVTMAGADEPDVATSPETAIRKVSKATCPLLTKVMPSASRDVVTGSRFTQSAQRRQGRRARDAIEKQFTAIFSESRMSSWSQPPIPSADLAGVAVEHGTAKLVKADHTLEESRTTSIFVKRDGNWLLDRVTEEEILEPISHYEQLKDLAWMVGKWTDQDDVATVTTECNWSRNNNFLVRSFAIQIADRIDMSGMQIIGWIRQRSRFAPGYLIPMADSEREPGPKKTIAGISNNWRFA